MRIERITDTILEYLPSDVKSGRFSLNLPGIARNLNKVALPIIALFAFSQAPTANAGPIAYGACVALCSVVTSFVGVPVCVVECLPLLGAPTP